MVTISYRIRGVEWSSMLRHDLGMSERLQAARGIVSDRTLRTWKTVGKGQRRTSVQQIMGLEQAVRERGLAPWDKHYFPTSNAMWASQREGGTDAVLRHLKLECDRLEKKEKLGEECPTRGQALEEALARVQLEQKLADKSAEKAQDVAPKIYAKGAAWELHRTHGGYAYLLGQEARSGLPDPETASPRTWTYALHLLDYISKTDVIRRKHRLDDGLDDGQDVVLYGVCWDWLQKACKQQLLSMSTVSGTVLRFHLGESALTKRWPQCKLLKDKTKLLSELEWLYIQKQYHEVVPGNFMAARNALVVASATEQRHHYEHWHHELMSYDDEWQNPVRMQDSGSLDEDFNDFVAWWREKKEESSGRRRFATQGARNSRGAS